MASPRRHCRCGGVVVVESPWWHASAGDGFTTPALPLKKMAKSKIIIIFEKRTVIEKFLRLIVKKLLLLFFFQISIIKYKF